MLRRLELEEAAAAAPHLAADRSEAVLPAVAEGELETALLPQEHPRWVKDALFVSQRARDIIARLRPIAIAVLSFWDHRIHSILVSGRRVCVDPSGCYRVDA